MKKIVFTFTFLTSLLSFSQSPIVEVCNGVQLDEAQPGTYFKDINNTFNKYTGTWKYENGDEIVIFEITKVTQKFDLEYQIFEDYLIGNYSYSTDGGVSYIINTITSTISEEVNNNPMYSLCQDNDNQITFIFEELLLNKGDYYCTATFEFLPNSLNQMKVYIKNPDGVVGSFYGDEPFNFNFSIPTEMIVIKQ